MSVSTEKKPPFEVGETIESSVRNLTGGGTQRFVVTRTAHCAVNGWYVYLDGIDNHYLASWFRKTIDSRVAAIESWIEKHDQREPWRDSVDLSIKSPGKRTASDEPIEDSCGIRGTRKSGEKSCFSKHVGSPEQVAAANVLDREREVWHNLPMDEVWHNLPMDSAFYGINLPRSTYHEDTKAESNERATKSMKPGTQDPSPKWSAGYGLMPIEIAVLDHLTTAWNSYLQLPNRSPEADADVRRAVDQINNEIAFRVAKRVNPEVWGK